MNLCPTAPPDNGSCRSGADYWDGGYEECEELHAVYGSYELRAGYRDVGSFGN